MKKIMVRADDLGYSNAVNYGIIDSVKNGIVNNVGVMVNMNSTLHGVNLIKNLDVDLGQHTNICIGKPISDPKLIPSLVDSTGHFKSSNVYRNAEKDFVVFEEVIIEIEAQLNRFIELFGKTPDYFEGHAISSQNFFRGLEYVAEKFDLKYSGFSFGGELITVGNTQVNFNMESMQPDYNPIQSFKSMLERNDESRVDLMILHPGYLDKFILENSSLTVPRVAEVDMACGDEIKKILKVNNINLLRYSEL